jgi:hypothetical protein
LLYGFYGSAEIFKQFTVWNVWRSENESQETQPELAGTEYYGIPVESRTLPAGCMDGHSPRIIKPQKYCAKYPIKIMIILELHTSLYIRLTIYSHIGEVDENINSEYIIASSG